LHSFLQGISFNNSAGESVFLNEKGETNGGFDITNLITFPNRSFQRVRVGKLNLQVPKGKELFIDEDIIVWNPALNQVLPLSRCNDPCFPGFQKKRIEGDQFCCYDCVPCPEGKISNQNDHYPNKERKGCILKLVKIVTLSCPASDAFLIPHEWYQPGDVIIGGIMSHIYYRLSEINFKEHSYITSDDIPELFHFLVAMTLVSLDSRRKGLRGISSAAMTVFHAQKGRFQIKM
ncbi:hypothetical protein E2320_003591, partial [Naja naja]